MDNESKTLKKIIHQKLAKWCEEEIAMKHDKWDMGVQYAHDVMYTDKYITCKYMKRQCFKFLLFLYKIYTDPDCPYIYDKTGMHNLEDVWEDVFKLAGGKFKDQPFVLYPNQAFKLAGYFGIRYKDEPKKIITQYFYDVEGRKQGKSEFISAVSTIIAADPFDIDAQAEIYYIGPIETSSQILFKKARTLIKKSPILNEQFPTNNKVRLESEDNASISALPFEVNKIEGQNFSLTVLTEYHLHPNDDMFQSANSGRNESRHNQVIFFDTTKGKNVESAAYVREMNYKRSLDEQWEHPEQYIDPSVFSFIAELDEEDDIEDRECWHKANPMMGVTVAMNSLENDWKLAKQNPHDRAEFITKRLGRWVGEYGSLLSLADMVESNNAWKEKYTLDKLKGKPCYIMIDLAKSHDLNAVSLLFKDKVDGQDVMIFHSRIFLPGGSIEEKMSVDKVDYKTWLDNGWAMLSGTGKTVNYADVAALINEYREMFDVRKIMYDPYQWATVQNILWKEYKMPEALFLEVKQNGPSLSSPMNLGLQAIWNKRFYYFGERHVLYQFLNVIPTSYQDQLYFSKQKQTKKIDSFATYITGMKEVESLPYLGSKGHKGVQVWKF